MQRKEEGMFGKNDYLSFMLGIFLIGGLLAIPIVYGLITEMSYFESLPWSLLNCIAFLIAFRRNGTISWVRFIPALLVVTILANIYAFETGNPAGGGGGFLVIILLFLSGYAGIGIKRLIKR